MNPIRFKIKLRDNERPDVSILTIKKMMENDNYIHPSMERTLKLIKKTRQPYIRLPLIKEMVLNLDEHVYYERSIKPENKPWVRWELDEHEIADYENDKEGFVKRVQEMYSKYLKSDFYDVENVPLEEIELIEKVTQKKKNEKGKDIKTKQKVIRMKR